jgi:IS30 family transposase
MTAATLMGGKIRRSAHPERLDEINSRPQEVLGWQTALEVFQAAVAALIA